MFAARRLSVASDIVNEPRGQAGQSEQRTGRIELKGAGRSPVISSTLYELLATPGTPIECCPQFG
jgi:hypothetical protein